MKTAMMELIKTMMEEWGEGRGLPIWAETALEEEKEQIYEAYCDGYGNSSDYKEISAIDYYDQKYK